jgi:hypothetical protein
MATKKAARQEKAKRKGRSAVREPEPERQHELQNELRLQRRAETDEAPRVPGVMTGIEIGHVAGEVWGVLSRGEPLTVVALKKEVKAPGDLVLAAIGWLAREDKVEFSTAGRTVKLSLR